MGTVAAEVAVPSRSGTKDTNAANTPAATQFFITGFARFHGVPENPTEAVALALQRRISSHPTLVCASVLETAAESVRRELDLLYARIADLPRGRRNVMVHFGVNSGARQFALERMARNEATFNCADEKGWAPIKHIIDRSYGSLAATRKTTLPVDALAADMRERGFDCGVSDDAGRFVCNWLYFHSLAKAERVGAVSLFVHVPATAVAPVDLQISFADALLECIAELQDNVHSDI